MTKNGIGSIFTLWPMMLKLREDTSTSEDKIKLIMHLTKWRNTNQYTESNSIRMSAKFSTYNISIQDEEQQVRRTSTERVIKSYI